MREHFSAVLRRERHSVVWKWTDGSRDVHTEETLKRAALTNVEDAENVVATIGFPVMVKASEGGGGKGIRKVNTIEELRTGFEQVKAEVPVLLFSFKSSVRIRGTWKFRWWRTRTDRRSLCMVAIARCNAGIRK